MGNSEHRRNIKRNAKSALLESRFFYPTKFQDSAGAWIILSILFLVILTALAIFILWNREEVGIDNLMIMGICILILYAMTINLFFFGLKLSSCKIYLLVNSEKVVQKNGIINKEIRLADIESIRRVMENRSYHNQLILIAAKKDRHKASSSAIWIDLSWYGEEAMLKFIDAVEVRQRHYAVLSFSNC